MKRIIQNKKYLIFVCILFIMVVLAIFLGLYVSGQHSSVEAEKSKEWIQDYLESNGYGSELSELDVQIMSANLSKQIEDKISDINFSTDLSQEQLRELMAMVNRELQYANFALSQEDISRLSSVIVKKILEDNLLSEDNRYLEYEREISNIERQLQDILNSLKDIDSQNGSIITDEQIQKIIRDTGLDEETIKGWINELLGDNINLYINNYEKTIQEIAEILNIDSQTLKELIEQAASTDDSVSYLARRLGIAEDRLNEILSRLNVSNNNELAELAAKLKNAQDSLQKQIDDNMSLTSNSITSVQGNIANNKKDTDKQISSVQQSITDHKKATDEQISSMQQSIVENKEYTDAAIDELQKNVLFYSYDEETNTLFLFEKAGGE